MQDNPRPRPDQAGGRSDGRGEAYSKTTYWRRTANPLEGLARVSPEEILENLKRIENIVNEIARMMKT